MGSDQFTFERDVLPVVKAWSQKALSENADRETKVNDAISIAWQMWTTAPSDTKPTKIAWYAIKSVKSNRHSSESIKCPLSPKRRPDQPGRSEIDTALQWRDSANPARVVAFRIDFQEWLADLEPQQRKIAELLAMGHRTQDIAEMISVTPGAVSQWRRRLADSWYSTR
jgi:hypothetical protein